MIGLWCCESQITQGWPCIGNPEILGDRCFVKCSMSSDSPALCLYGGTYCRFMGRNEGDHAGADAGKELHDGSVRYYL